MAFGVSVAEACSITVDTPTAGHLLAAIEQHLRGGSGFAVATLNMDHIHKLQRSDDFRAAYLRQSHVVADGNPVVWLSHIAGHPVQLAPGSDLIEPLAALAARLDAPIALLGSTQEALDKAARVLTERSPNLRVVACISPAFGFDVGGEAGALYLEAVRASGARLCFLALGSPKQEIFSARGLNLVPGCGFISIGAGIDFLAGRQRRAPGWVRAIAMEWFWRMASDPRRLAGRYARGFTILPGLILQAIAIRLEDSRAKAVEARMTMARKQTIAFAPTHPGE